MSAGAGHMQASTPDYVVQGRNTRRSRKKKTQKTEDIKKITVVRSLVPEHLDAVLKILPRDKPGEKALYIFRSTLWICPRIKSKILF